LLHHGFRGVIGTAIEEASRLRFMVRKVENGRVQAARRWTGCAIAILFVCLGGLAQNQDRDPNRPSRTSATAPAPEDRIDINHASVDELVKVPGLTRSWAERIVRFRPYHAKNDLLDKGVVSGEIYDRIKDYVVAHREKQ
jgi:DNA uptake protein ComE-like DNA-binding protein